MPTRHRLLPLHTMSAIWDGLPEPPVTACLLWLRCPVTISRWPAFDKCFKGAVVTEEDNQFGRRRIEIMCSSCGGHLGHVFDGEQMTDTDERHCVNSVSVKFMNAPVPEGLSEETVA